MNFNFDTGAIYGGLQSLDVSTLPPLGGTAGVLSIIGNGALTLPKGTDAQQPGTPESGMFRFNTDTTLLEYYNGTTWAPLATSASSVSSVAANSNSSSLTITGSPITSAGTFQFTLDAGLEALGAFNTTGVLVATGANTWASRTVTGTAGTVVVTNGDGVAGNPTITLDTAGTPVSDSFVKITTDTFGRVTATSAVAESDITTLVDSVYVNLTGDTMASGADLTFVGGGEVLGLPASPSGDTAAASKAYVDSVAAGLSWKQSVKVATTTDITLSGLQTIDGYTTLDGDRVLVKDQTDDAENGIYIAATGAWTRSTDMDQTTPINEINGAATFVENGSTQADTGWTQIDNVTVIGTDPIMWVQYSGSGTYTAGTGLALTGTVFSIDSPIAVSLGGTGLTSTPTNGQLLIGNGAGYTLATLTDGSGISITEGAGTITVANTGVLSLTGTANEVTVSASTGAITVGLPDDVTVGTSLTVSTLTPNAALYVGAAGLLSSTAALTDGQILVGSTGNAPVAATLTAGTGVTITNAAGSITIDADNNGTVTSIDVSGGTTGLTTTGGPVTTSGTITLTGTLAPSNGGTGLTALGTSNQVLGVNAAGDTAEYKTIAAGTGMSVVHGANVVTLNNTGVTSVALTAPSIFTVSGSPVTTTGTLDFALNEQAANTVFVGPATGVDAVPTFRALSYADLPFVLYTENAVSPVANTASGDNSVAIGSGASATATGTLAIGTGASADIEGQKAFANGSFASAGDAQHSVYVARNITTDDTVTELFLDGSAVQLVMPDNSVFTFDILVAARRTDDVGGGAAYRFLGAARKDATSGSVTFIGTPSKTIIGETNTPWDAAVAVDTGTGAFLVNVTGEDSKTIRWVATIQTTEVRN